LPPIRESGSEPAAGGDHGRVRKVIETMRTTTMLRTAAGIGLVLGILGCASRAPDVEAPPTAYVEQLASTVMTPEVVKFEAKVLIQNRMRASMDFERVDYAVDLYDTELFASSFADMKRTRGGGRQWVTFPFQIAVADIMAQAVDTLAEGSIRVTFRGRVYPAPSTGFGPLPFAETVVVPIPKIPEVSFEGTEGVPLSEMFRVMLRVRNRNDFDLSVQSVDSYLEINGHRYPLLHTVQATHIGEGENGIVTLQMEQTPGKSLSMILSTLESQHPTFSVGGTIAARTQYGWIYIPVRVDSSSP
jgi:hypothetical protein